MHQYPGAKVFGQIRLLGEELEIIEKTLAKQYQLVRDFAQITDERNLPYDDDNLSQQQDFSTYSGKLRRRVLSRTADSLNEKLEDIRELKDRAAFMQWSVSESSIFMPYYPFFPRLDAPNTKRHFRLAKPSRSVRNPTRKPF